MGLEEDIRQHKFESNFQKVLLNILYTSEFLSNSIRPILKSFKLTEPQYNILRILAGSHPQSLTPGEIKKVMIFKRSDLTRMMDRLNTKDLISRKICPENRRKVNINITPKGMDLLNKINPMISEGTNIQLANKLTKAEVDQLNKLLDKLRA